MINVCPVRQKQSQQRNTPTPYVPHTSHEVCLGFDQVCYKLGDNVGLRAFELRRHLRGLGNQSQRRELSGPTTYCGRTILATEP